MIRQIIITWFRLSVAVAAIAFLVFFFYKSYSIHYIIPCVIGTLVIAIVIELVKDVRTKLNSF